MEYCPGVKINNAAALDAQVRPPRVRDAGIAVSAPCVLRGFRPH